MAQVGQAEHFPFADAWWFRGPLRLITLGVIVFSLLSLWPALADGANPDHGRAVWGLVVLGVFVVGAVAFMVSINESYVEVGAGEVSVRFEAFFGARFPVEDVVSVGLIDPKPRWRYRWGLATNWRDRVSCSHGGAMVEVVLREPVAVRLWPRTMQISRFWLAPRDAGGFVLAVNRARGLRPDVRRAA